MLDEARGNGRRSAWALMALLSMTGGCAHRFVECNDTLSCRAQVAERDRQFARAVADEPTVARLEVEPVSAQVLVSRDRGLVYAMDPALVALDLRTGQERWRVETSGVVFRVGRLLVVVSQRERSAGLVFVDPEAPKKKASECVVPLPAPSMADTFGLHAFDRRGQPYLFWSSGWSYDGGTPPNLAATQREVDAEACGVLKVDMTTCAVTPERLEDFLFDPPEGRRPVLVGRSICGSLAPLRDIAAAAASAPKASSVLPLVSTSTGQATLRVTRTELPVEGRSCERTDRYVLEARDDTSVPWTHPLEDRLNTDRCPPPP